MSVVIGGAASVVRVHPGPPPFLGSRSIWHRRPPSLLWSRRSRAASRHQPPVAAMTDAPKVTVRAAAANDWDQFKTLWDGYCVFYNSTVPLEITQHTWARCLDASDPNVMCLVAQSTESGAVVGFATGIVHPSTFSKTDMLYLEDLFVAPGARKMGAATSLINAMKDTVVTQGYRKLYWHTLQDNEKAQSLYGKVATLTKFIRYDAD